MKKPFKVFLGLWILCLVVGLSCEQDTILPPEGTYVQRYVQQITEANLSGQGGVVDMPSLSVSPPGGIPQRMPMVLVYGDNRSSSEWSLLSADAYYFSEGQIHIDPTIGNSGVYRILVLK